MKRECYEFPGHRHTLESAAAISAGRRSTIQAQQAVGAYIELVQSGQPISDEVSDFVAQVALPRFVAVTNIEPEEVVEFGIPVGMMWAASHYISD